MNIKDFKKNKIPDKPGVYFFLKGKSILYIGKATSLRDRTRSYFGKDLINTRGSILVDMVFKADKVKWQETDSVLESLIQEANLIKKYQPYYNTKEKDDKSFNYVCITKEVLPKILVIRGKDLKQHTNKLEFVRMSKIYGPFPNGIQLKEGLKIIRKIFPFLDDKSGVRGRYEFYRQINLVPDKEDKAFYLKNIKNIKLFFEGKKGKILKDLEKEMKIFAKQQKFERAGELKRQIFALKHINDVSLIKEDSLETRNYKLEPNRIEAYDVAHMSGKNMVGVMTVLENGEIIKKEYKKFIIKTQNGTNDTGALEEILSRRFRHTEWGIPNLVVVDGGIAQINVAKRVLSRYQLKIPIIGVVKNEKHKAEKLLGNESIIKLNKKYIVSINEEAHRFAISYYRFKSRKNMFK
jgi:excinuclease ABC subunit C